MTKIIDIDVCIECPYCIKDSWNCTFICEMADNKIIEIDVEKEIADFCKLMDVKK